VLVLCEEGRAGAAAIDMARELAEPGQVTLTVVGVAPRAPSGPRCGNSAFDYNQAVAESVLGDLDRARVRLGPVAQHTKFQLLIEGTAPSLEQFARSGAFDLVLLPARRRPLRAAHHPAAARLKLIPGAEILIVEPRASGVRPRSRRRVAGAGGS
jgi:nucleotide-binding universal stress UspA family protein